MNAPGSVASGRVLMIGPPNAGKSTLFNRLTGSNADTGNYAGTTVSVHRAHARVGDREVAFVDLPGTASLVAGSSDEEVTLRAVLDLAASDEHGLVLLVLDGPRLSRSLYLALQVLALEVPVVVAVNLLDEARSAGRIPDAAALSEGLGVPVVAVSARTGEGLEALGRTLAGALERPADASNGVHVPMPDALAADLDAVAAELPEWARDPAHPRRTLELAAWALQSVDGALAAGRPVPAARIREVLGQARAVGRDPEAELVGARYAWIDARMPVFVGRGAVKVDAPSRRTELLDAVLLHPVLGTVTFLGVMAVVFMALFAWSDPAIGWIEDRFADLGAMVSHGFEGPIAQAGTMGPTLAIIRDLLVDGVIGGVGAVLVFLPQIALLFLLLSLLEDCGYLARAAALMDRLLRLAGLPGKAFVPLLSGYACAVPAILATRSIPRWRDRLLTMLVLPLTSCSARLPVYTLMIGALFPATVVLAGVELPARPAALMGMYLFSTAVSVGAAVVLGRTLLPAAEDATVLELPPYRMPIPRNVVRTVWSRSKDFVQEAGRVILVATMVLWALLSFPRYAPADVLPPEVMAEAVADGADAEALDELAAPYALRGSYAGRLGRILEPAIAPLGFDWKIGVGLVGAFAAREVFVSTMGVVYGVSDADEEDVGLREKMLADTRADGTPLFTPLTGLSVMVFFALSMQCLSTLAVLRKETGGWRWPMFVTGYMTVLAWVAALVVYQAGRALGWA